MKDRIRHIVRDHGHLSVDVDALDDASDLYSAGMTSHRSVVVMLALENEFGMEFPAALLNRNVFKSVNSIASALDGLAVTGESH